MDGEEGREVVIGRSEIDTRASFRSVKEAVMLFGERVLVGEVYANKLKEIRAATNENAHTTQSRYGAVTAELEETKRDLQKVREESGLMADSIKSLTEELEQTKREIQKSKARDDQAANNELFDPEIEELKFIENGSKVVEFNTQCTAGGGGGGGGEGLTELQEKRYVTFASPASLARVLASKDGGGDLQGKTPYKMKKKPLNPLLGWLFSKKKEIQDGESLRA